MKRYTIQYKQKVIEIYEIEVEARSLEEALDRAEDMAGDINEKKIDTDYQEMYDFHAVRSMKIEDGDYNDDPYSP